jgi:hypothetical protein
MAESAINSIMIVSRTIMVKSELGARFLFNSAVAGCDARNVIDKERIGTTPWRPMHSEKVMYPSPDFACGCPAWVHLKILNSQRRDKGSNHTTQAVEQCYSIHLAFKPKTSFFILFPEKNTVISSNQAQLNEIVLLFWKKTIVEKYHFNNTTDVLYHNSSNVKWLSYKLTTYTQATQN